MLKRTVCAALSAAVLMSGISSYAEDSTLVHNLSLADAIAMATDESPELQACDENKQALTKQVKAAAITQKDSKDIPVYASSNFELVYVKNGYYVNMYKAYLDLSDEERAKTEASISYDTTQKYYTYKNTLKLCDVAQRGVERAEENLAIVKEKHALGMCTEMNVTNAEIAVEEAKANLVSTQNNSDLALGSLKIRLGIDDEAAVNLTDTIESTEFSADLAADTKKALESRYDVKMLKVTEKLAEQYFNISSLLGDENPAYYSSHADYIKSANNYTTGIKNIALGVKSAYYDVINAQNSAAIAKKKLDYKKNEYEVYKLRFEMGTITNNVLTALSDELTACEITYENALLTQKLAVENYNYQITVGL